MVEPPTAARYFSSPANERGTLERSFSYGIRLANGTRRYTYADRLHDVNRWCEGMLPRAEPLRVLDVAMSSGVTTLEWLNALESAGHTVVMTGSDLLLSGLLIRATRRLAVLTDPCGDPLQYSVGRTALPSPAGGRNTLRFFAPLALLAAVRRLALSRRSGMARPTKAVSMLLGLVSCSEVDFVHPDLRRNARVQLQQEDLLTNPDAHKYHVVRAANILNRCYFSGEQLCTAIRNLGVRLLPGGVLIICSTSHEDTNAATALIRSEDDRLEIIDRLNGGVDVETMAIGTRCDR